jgi:hypothetical protein
MNIIKKFLKDRHLTQTSQIIAVIAALVLVLLGLPLLAGFYWGEVTITEIRTLAGINGLMLFILGAILSVLERKQEGITLDEWQSVIFPSVFCTLFLLVFVFN